MKFFACFIIVFLFFGCRSSRIANSVSSVRVDSTQVKSTRLAGEFAKVVLSDSRFVASDVTISLPDSTVIHCAAIDGSRRDSSNAKADVQIAVADFVAAESVSDSSSSSSQSVDAAPHFSIYILLSALTAAVVSFLAYKFFHR